MFHKMLHIPFWIWRVITKSVTVRKVFLAHMKVSNLLNNEIPLFLFDSAVLVRNLHSSLMLLEILNMFCPLLLEFFQLLLFHVLI